MEVISRLGVGPMSRQIIEAVYSYAQARGAQLMLIASKNQIDAETGYVFTTAAYRDYLNQLQAKYPQAQVLICRDHCGPGHNGNFDIRDTYQTIDTDIANGFDLIHVDFCHLDGSQADILQQSKRAIEYIGQNAPAVMIEIGTDENSGELSGDMKRIEEQMMFFTLFAEPYFYVSQTGTLIKEVQQEGSLERKIVRQLREMADRYGLRLKEHNADFLTAEDIKARRGLIDALNIAPQLGFLQTKLTLLKAMLYGIDTSEFMQVSYKSRKWEKWLYRNSKDNKYLCSVIAGHYNFGSDAYRRLHAQIMERENFDEVIQQEMHCLFDHYLVNLGEVVQEDEVNEFRATAA